MDHRRPSLGAAVAGGVGVGLFPDFSVAEKLTPSVGTIRPNTDLQPLYDRLYVLCNRAYALIEPLYAELAEF